MAPWLPMSILLIVMPTFFWIIGYNFRRKQFDISKDDRKVMAFLTTLCFITAFLPLMMGK